VDKTKTEHRLKSYKLKVISVTFNNKIILACWLVSCPALKLFSLIAIFQHRT
jgi:hypothetical protein